MKTPHSLVLIRGESIPPRYDPVTDTYNDAVAPQRVTVPCMANHISQAKVFEEYGNRTEKILIARFNQEQAPFNQAEYQGGVYVPIEQIDAPIKGSVRLKWAGVADG